MTSALSEVHNKRCIVNEGINALVFRLLVYSIEGNLLRVYIARIRDSDTARRIPNRY